MITDDNPKGWAVVETIEKWRTINPEILKGRENEGNEPTFTENGFIKI